MSFEFPKIRQYFSIPKEAAYESVRPLTEKEMAGLGISAKKEAGKEEGTSEFLRTKWKNPETGEEKEIKIDIQREIEFFEKIYQDNLGIKIDQKEILSIWSKNFESMKKEIESYGYDTVLIIPDNLPEEENLNRDLIESMEEDVVENGQTTKKKVNKTRYWTDQNSLKSAGEQKCRIILVHSDQNIYENLAANPYLKATLNKNIPQLVFSISQEEWGKLDNEEKKKKAQESFKKLEAGANIDFETEINGQKAKIEAEGLSLGEYQIFQRIYFEKTNPGNHLDASGWTLLPKSFSGSSVAGSGWYPTDRQLVVAAHDPSYSDGALGLRLSRSFS